MIGQTLGHYCILEKIGAGGMGVVYRARDERLDREVALKVLPASTLADEAARRRFRHEALMLAKLNHPNIGVVHDFDTQDGVDFLVMEYVPGATLSRKLTAGALPEKEVARLGGQVAAALEEAHEHGVIHRDLKPGNILVTPKDQAKVMDFGLAKLLRPASEMTATTETLGDTAVVAGTLPYMAPEQLQGGPADVRSDIYAAGAVLYEMATGQRAFRETLSSRLTDAILHQPPVPPRTVNARVSTELEHIILKCLDKEPENRYQSAKELGVDLRRLTGPSTVSVAVPATPTRMPSRRAIAISGIAFLLLLATMLAVNVGGWRERLMGKAVGAHIRSLAVLPLENLSRDPEQEYFTDGMTEALITNLGKISALRVISRTSVMQYKGVKKPLPQIARELNVDAVVEGAVQRSGDRVRITAQLIEAPSDKHLWGQSYDRDARDVLALQSEVARAIANEIQIKLTPQEKARLATARPVNPEAHEAYLKGRYFLNKFTPDGLKKSVQYFDQAIERDPGSALAYAGSADWYIFGGSGLPPKEAMPRAKAAAAKALEIDDTLVEAHISLAFVRLFYDWDWPGVEKDLRGAIELNPGYATAHALYAVYLATTGHLNEAIAESKWAQELDPLSPLVSEAFAEILYHARQYDQAIAQCKKMLELDPNSAGAHSTLGLIYQQKKMFEEAVAETQTGLTLSGEKELAIAYGRAYSLSGYRSAVQRILDEAAKKSSERTYFAVAADYAFLGEKEKAFAWLEKAYEVRSPGVLFLKVDPRLDPLRSDPRFADLLRRMGLPP